MDNNKDMEKRTDYSGKSTFELVELQELVNDYFAGTISTVANRQLLSSVRDFEKGELNIEDEELRASLSTISLIEQYSSASLASLAAAMPDDLEKRLNEHIGALAKTSRNRWRWIKVTAAAACLACAVTVAVKVSHQPHSQQPDLMAKGQYTYTTVLTGDPDTVSKEETEVAPPLTPLPSDNKPQLAKANNPTSSSVSSKNKPSQPKGDPNLPSSLSQVYISASTLPSSLMESAIPNLSVSNELPVKLVVLPENSNNLAMANADPAELINRPLDNLYNTLEKLGKSIRVVNAAFYEASETAATLSGESLDGTISNLRAI